MRLLEKPIGCPARLISTAIVVFGWGYFIWNNSIGTIWPMFGVANQLLAGVALTIATTALINSGKAKYIWTTIIPQIFVVITTLYAAWLNIFTIFMPLLQQPDKAIPNMVNIILTAIIMICAVVMLVESARRAYKVLSLGKYSRDGVEISVTDPDFAPPTYGEA